MITTMGVMTRKMSKLSWCRLSHVLRLKRVDLLINRRLSTATFARATSESVSASKLKNNDNDKPHENNVNGDCSRNEFTRAEAVTVDSPRLVASDLLQMFYTKVKDYKSSCVPIVHHDKYVCEFPVEHRFCMLKFHGVMARLRNDNLIDINQVVEPEEITQDLCSLVHDPDYIHRFFTGLTSDKEQRISGFRWSPGIVSRCRHETGGTLLACQLAMDRGIACSTGGGTHHAFRSHGSGYCAINDMAIAAETMIHNKTVDKVLIVDLDVHQGDGTASIMVNNPDIFTFSMHCQSNFPFKKQSSDLDIGLQDHVGDREYLKTLEDCLPWVVDAFRPDLVIYDAGIDVHVNDELGRLDLTDEGIFQRDSYVLNLMKSRGIPIATVIGGGYSRNLDVLSRRHTIVHRAAFEVWKRAIL